MPGWLLAAALLAAPEGEAWSPAEAPPPTPWALAGARGWRLCQEAERRAASSLGRDAPRDGGSGDELLWQRHAQQCPHAVHVLVAAGQNEIVEASDLFREIDMGDELDTTASAEAVQQVVEQHHARLEVALGWLDAAIAESERQGQRPPYQAHYYRAYALTALGRVPQAREAIRTTIERGDVERWRSERMAALVELFAGDTDQALRRADRGVYDAPAEERLISRLMRALVLDRAGASAEAQAELRALQRQPGTSMAQGQGTMETVLPIHERLFFRALYSQAIELRSPALRFWQAYLARPEPEEPERVLAQRHLDELSPPPPPAGGP
ncbi:MAG: hypothetical protein KDK70_30650 [Myxococcales bacterium]|nr:hypothetical protein [Myxococcales bacterium]